jgi:hypothetical protein
LDVGGELVEVFLLNGYGGHEVVQLSVDGGELVEDGGEEEQQQVHRGSFGMGKARNYRGLRALGIVHLPR